LLDRLTDEQHAPVLLLHGSSGVGKTSLITAGLLPRLSVNNQVNYIRRDFEKGLLGSVIGCFPTVSDELDLLDAWKVQETNKQQALFIILDQVEEVFTRLNPEIEHELTQLVKVIADIFANPQTRPKGKLILSFRKEWLPEIDQALGQYKIPHSAYFLAPLNKTGIIEAIEGPTRLPRLAQHYNLSIESGLASTIADTLLKDRDSPVAPVLQILLSKLWTAAKQQNYSSPTFDTTLYEQLEKQGLLLSDFLEQQIAIIKTQHPKAVESGLLLDLLAFFTTTHGTATEHAKEIIHTQYAHCEEQINSLVKSSIDNILLIEIPQNQQAQSKFRLVHDTLAPIIRARFEESDLPGQRARRILENRAVEWHNEQQGTPLDERDLLLVEQGREGMRNYKTEESQLVQVSNIQNLQRAQRRKLLKISSSVAVLLIIVTAIIAIWQGIEANHQKITAIQAEKRAKSNENSAVKAKQLAENRLIEMQHNYGLVLKEKGLAAVSEKKYNEAFIYFSHANAASNNINIPIAKYTDKIVPNKKILLSNSIQFQKSILSPKGKIISLNNNLGEIQTTPILTNNNQNTLITSMSIRGEKNISPDGKYLVTTIFNDINLDYDLHLMFAKDLDELPKQNKEKVILAKIGEIYHLRVFNKNNTIVIDKIIKLSTGSPILNIFNESLDAEALHLATVQNERNVLYFIKRENGFPIQLWNVDTGRKIKTFEKSKIADNWLDGGKPIMSFSPDSRYLAWSGYDNQIKVWDLVKSKYIHTFTVDSFQRILSFSPDSKILISRLDSSTLAFWNLSSGELVSSLKHPGSVVNIAFSSDMRLLATMDIRKGNKQFLNLWDVKSGKIILDSFIDDKYYNLVTPVFFLFSPDNRWIATAQRDNVTLWNSENLVKQAIYDSKNTTNMLFSPDSLTLVTTNINNIIAFWDNISGQSNVVSTTQNKEIEQIAFSNDGHQLVTLNSNNSATIWQISKTTLFPFYKGKIYNKVFARSLNKDIFLLSNGRGGSKFLEALESKIINLKAYCGASDNYLFSNSGNYMASIHQNMINLCNRLNNSESRQITNKKSVSGIAISPDDKTLAVFYWDNSISNNSITLWDTSSGNVKFTLKGHEAQVTGVSFSSNNHWLASASYDKTVRLWNANTGEEKYILSGHTWGVKHVSFSADGETLASAGGDNKIILWDVKTGRQKSKLIGHKNSVINASFSPNKKYLFSEGLDDSIRWWDIETGKSKILSQAPSNRAINSTYDFVFSPDGQTATLTLIKRYLYGYFQSNLIDISSGEPFLIFEDESYNATFRLFYKNRLLIIKDLDIDKNDEKNRLWDTEDYTTIEYWDYPLLRKIWIAAMDPDQAEKLVGLELDELAIKPITNTQFVNL